MSANYLNDREIKERMRDEFIMFTKIVDINTKNGCACNNNCVFCASSPREGCHDDYINPQDSETERVKLELHKPRLKKTKVVYFTASGGEPTLRKDIIELLSYANELGYKQIYLQTNGRMFCYPEFTKRVVDAGCNSTQISLHAHSAELYDRITRAPGSFEQTVQGIKNLLQYRDEIVIEISVLFNKMNYKHLPAIARFICKEFKGIDEVKFYPVDPAGTAPENHQKLLVRMSVVKPYLEKALAILASRGFNFAISFMPYCVIDKKYWRDISSKVTRNKGFVTYKSPPRSAKESHCVIFKSCEGCVMKEKCPGIWQSYTSRVGTDEFKPISSV